MMVQKVSFKYPGTENYIYKDLEFGIDLDSRVALVGPNGIEMIQRKKKIMRVF